MTTFQRLTGELLANMADWDLQIPTAGVKFYRIGETVPPEVKAFETEGVSLASCQANRQAGLGDAVFLTRQNIGCIAAAITLGLVDRHRKLPMEGPRVYTEIMRNQSGKSDFSPPTPADFSDGTVYAAPAAGRKEFCLFGEKDSGRFATPEIARKAMAEMTAIQPPNIEGIFFYNHEFDELDLIPDVVTMNVRPVELTRIGQAYAYNTGERVEGSMGPVRVVNSDLIVRPYLSGKMNFSSYCVGARLIAQYEADRLGLGIPWKAFEVVVQGMKDSRFGYPFPNYPGAKEG